LREGVEKGRRVEYDGDRWKKVGKSGAFCGYPRGHRQPIRLDRGGNRLALLIPSLTFFMLIGEYRHTIDEKGRLALPTKFRSVLSKGVVVTRGVDQCLFVYSREAWDRLARRVATLPITQKNTRAFSRLMLAGAMDLPLDGQGRIVLPEYLRGYGKITKNVVVAGVYDRLEIWDAGLWNAYTKNAEKHSAEIAETLGSFGGAGDIDQA
jgi:MraZ protein